MFLLLLLSFWEPQLVLYIGISSKFVRMMISFVLLFVIAVMLRDQLLEILFCEHNDIELLMFLI